MFYRVISHVRATASNILTVVYGWPRIGPKDKPLIKRIHAHTARIASAILPGAYLVELFPLMKHLPTWMAKWKREGLEWHEQETKMFEEFNAGVNDKLVNILFYIGTNNILTDITTLR